MKHEAVTFECEGSQLLGIVHGANDTARRGAVVVVGGPQYRVGSHRQFVHLARALGDGGIPTLRFDYRGMGDSDGELVGFEDVTEDIRSAVDALCRRCPQLDEIMLVGLCDAASAVLMYAPLDARVQRLVIMNPWVRSEESHARAQVKHYYLQRLLAPEMWGKILRGKFDWRGSLASLSGTLRSLTGSPSEQAPAAKAPYQQRMLTGAQQFDGEMLLIISGDDMTAAEFIDHVGATPAWGKVLARSTTTVHKITQANHTFACAEWRDEVGDEVLRWISAS
ncbi:MAG: hydrolase 1, exosortase A system-associated [Gammaproteobacteria bacterium]